MITTIFLNVNALFNQVVQLCFFIIEICILCSFLSLCTYYSHNLYFRKINKMKVFDSPLPCRKKSVYSHTLVKSEEASTYQELDLSENAYQNTTIR